jgi:hypothetical protein
LLQENGYILFDPFNEDEVDNGDTDDK